MLPNDFPPRQSVYSHYCKWCHQERWFLIHRALHQQTRVQASRDAQPSAAIIDSQSVRTTALAESRGVDGYKKIKGHKRHVVVDIMGIPLQVFFQTGSERWKMLPNWQKN